MWVKSAIVAFVILAAAFAAARVYGGLEWREETQGLRLRLEAARAPIEPEKFSPRELDDLPAPVRSYFQTVLKDGQALIASARLQHRGSFNMSETGEQWKRFSSVQRVITHRPGFLWDAKIAMMPGLPVHVHDAYVAGEGILHASLLGLTSMVDIRGTGDVARGELLRYLAEAVWYPTALLPSQGVVWKAVDDHSADATLSDGKLSLTLRFHFGDDGLVDTVSAESRGRTVQGHVMQTPWQGRFWDYQSHNGMRVPMQGEVAWVLPDGPHPYWRGRMTHIEYEFVP